MPKRSDLHSILIIGSGPIAVGQACEFDYSGVQACKALREEGYRIILVNSNPATIMTDPETADAIYIEPIRWQTIEKIIERERPDAILPTMGGQTALNCALDLERNGVLERYDVELIGAKAPAIEKAENRQKFKETVIAIGLESARSVIARNLEEAMEGQAEIGFPTVVRPSFTLGGTGSGIAYNHEEFLDICKRALDISPIHEVLIEESLIGWKEFEMEVIRDHADNCIIVCSIENFDPMGIHTGDSITVAPAQTLTDKEYQRMRNASIAVLREIGVDTGGSNVQFAIHPTSGRMVVIEMNPRVSRSSALASKATGFPIAKIAAKLSVGYTLDELKNDITSSATPASFEPTVDYIVTKMPRFAFEKFPQADHRLTTQMKSVGEIMAIGRTFQESLQKAMRSLEIGSEGFDEQTTDPIVIETELSEPGPDRLWYIGDAFRQGWSLERVQQLTHIDPWFLYHIQELIHIENHLQSYTLDTLSENDWKLLKRFGFSDPRLAKLLGVNPADVLERRHELNIHPVYKRVDTCAAEFAPRTAYLYSTYESFCEAEPSERQKVVILGGGPNRIGQGIAFDYCCVHAAFALREQGFETIIVNCNPETVSTDYDTSDRLYFEPLTLEDVLEILVIEKPLGVIVQYGGQTSLKFARALADYGIPIIGTLPENMDIAEDREQLQKTLNNLGLRHPPHYTAYSAEEALRYADEIGYPLLIRPFSSPDDGHTVEIIHLPEELATYMQETYVVSEEAPLLLDCFLSNATEVDVDAISDGHMTHVAGVMEHIEHAGIHSGDSACSIPPYSLSESIQDEIRQQTTLLAKALKIVGLLNVQFAIQNGDIYVLAVNPRASRTIPFVSKSVGIPLAKLAACCMTGFSLETLLAPYSEQRTHSSEFYTVKEAIFPFIKFPDADTLLGPEMKSTGEVMGIGQTFAEAFYKAQVATGIHLPLSGCAFLSVRNADKSHIVDIASMLHELGFRITATRGTAAVIQSAGLPATIVNKVHEGRPNIVDHIKNRDIHLVIYTVDDQRSAIRDSFAIRRAALHERLPCFTTLAGAHAATLGIQNYGEGYPYALHDIHYSLSHSEALQ